MSKKQFYLIIALIILVSAAVIAIGRNKTSQEPKNNSVTNNQIVNEKKIGGDRDSHGCLVGAGYSWCAPKNKCLRVWEEGCQITVTQPKVNDLVSSPLVVTGEVEASWLAGAMLPIKLVDEDYNNIALSHAQTETKATSTSSVPFQSTIKFNTKASRGYLIIENSNSSNEEGLNDSFRVPVRFK